VLPAAAARILSDLARLRWDDIAVRESEAADRRSVGVALHRLLAQHVDRYRRPRALALLKKVDVDPAERSGSGSSAEFPSVA
jgi:hypothetical protein